MTQVKSKSAIYPERQRGGAWDVFRRMYYRLYFTLKPPIDISDEYINWLYNVNAGLLVPGNLYCFDYAIRNLPSPSPLLEIGSFCGLSTNVITYYKQKHGAANRLITCDTWEFEEATPGGMVGASQISLQEYRQFARETFLRNTRMFSRYDLPSTVELLSDDFFAAWEVGRVVALVHGGTLHLGGPLSFCYIDGNHAFEQVRRDFEHCHAYLERGGFILFDDSADGWGWEGVRRVVAAVRRHSEYELVIRNPNYLFRKAK